MPVAIPALIPARGKARSTAPQPKDRPVVDSAVKRHVHATNRMFRELGVDESRGTGPIEIAIDPPSKDPKTGEVMIDPKTGKAKCFHNAAYMRIDDSLKVGHVAGGVNYGYAKDVIAHELSHRVVDKHARLLPLLESGAVNESLADTFAMNVDKRNWTVGESVVEGGMRSMRNPSRDLDALYVPVGMGADGKLEVVKKSIPSSMDDYWKLSPKVDGGGVHINMGIPNKAAYLIGSKLGRDEMAKLYMSAIRDHLHAEDVGTLPKVGKQNWISFAGLAQSTIDAANQLYTKQPENTQAVKDAWAAVGLTADAIDAGLAKQKKMGDTLRDGFAQQIASGAKGIKVPL